MPTASLGSAWAAATTSSTPMRTNTTMRAMLPTVPRRRIHFRSPVSISWFFSFLANFCFQPRQPM